MSAINIIYGASVVGEVLCKYLQKTGTIITCFCDNNPMKNGGTLCAKEILSFQECCMRYENIHFYIAMNDIKYADQQINSVPEMKIVYTNSIIEKLLKEKGELCSSLQTDKNIVKYMLETCATAQKYYGEEQKLYVRTLQLLVTERCSLKCKECSNLIQYYENPKDCDYKLILDSIDAVEEKIDEVTDLHLIGGEPFINNKIFDIISHVLTKKNIHNIIIFTNGTIVPTEEKLSILKNDRIIIHISNYGALSRNLDKLTDALSKNQIHFDIYNDLKWNKHSEVKDYHLTEKQQESRLQQCRSAVNCIEMGDGKLFRCFYANHVYRQKAVPEEVNEYLDILNPMVTKQDIYKFLYKKKLFKVCNWCNGMNFSNGTLPPAQQTTNPLNYTKYTYSD